MCHLIPSVNPWLRLESVRLLRHERRLRRRRWRSLDALHHRGSATRISAPGRRIRHHSVRRDKKGLSRVIAGTRGLQTGRRSRPVPLWINSGGCPGAGKPEHRSRRRRRHRPAVAVAIALRADAVAIAVAIAVAGQLCRHASLCGSREYGTRCQADRFGWRDGHGQQAIGSYLQFLALPGPPVRHDRIGQTGDGPPIKLLARTRNQSALTVYGQREGALALGFRHPAAGKLDGCCCDHAKGADRDFLHETALAAVAIAVAVAAVAIAVAVRSRAQVCTAPRPADRRRCCWSGSPAARQRLP